jgi:hypothetical protein
MYADAGEDVLQDSMGWLATVTRLQDLTVTLEEQDVSIAALLPLTKVTCLTQLSCCLHDENHENEWLCNFTTKVRHHSLCSLVAGGLSLEDCSYHAPLCRHTTAPVNS